MRNRTFRIPFACIALLLAGPLAAEDLTILSKTTFGDRETDTTQFITSEYSRASSPDADSIVHFPTGKVTVIDRKKKEYWEATLEEMEAFWRRTAREMRTSGMADMFGLRDEPEIEKLPGKKTFAGYECEHYSLSIGDVLELDFWAAPGLEPPSPYYDGRRLSTVAMGPMGQLFQKMYEELKKVKGFPLSTAIIVRTPMSRTQTLEEATEVRKGKIPASTFEIPAGYKKTKSPFGK